MDWNTARVLRKALDQALHDLTVDRPPEPVELNKALEILREISQALYTYEEGNSDQGQLYTELRRIAL